jgi:hypothetical protein
VAFTSYFLLAKVSLLLEGLIAGLQGLGPALKRGLIQCGLGRIESLAVGIDASFLWVQLGAHLGDDLFQTGANPAAHRGLADGLVNRKQADARNGRAMGDGRSRGGGRRRGWLGRYWGSGHGRRGHEAQEKDAGQGRGEDIRGHGSLEPC